jgi:alpha-tubulin suppressor-like RCC1 family protein/sugar lactone lactonase YvrE
MFRALFLSLVCIGSAVAQTYTTSVLAGAIGQSGSADGTGGAARFNSPSSMGADAAGNLYLVDGAGAAVRKITPAGVVTTLVSSLGGNQAIAVSAAGTVYLADRSNHAIYRLSSEGSLVLIAGQTGTSGNANGTGAAARFASPAGLTVDAAGSLYVSDTGNYTVRKITSAGVVTTLAGLAGVSGAVDGPGPLARFYSPGALAVDASGNLYLLDGSNYSSNPTLRRIAPSGEVSTLAGGGYQYSTSFDGTGSSVSFNAPLGLAWDASSGALFVTDTGRHTVRRVTTTGVVTTVLGLAGTSGSADGLGTQARFSSPAGLAVNAAGDLLIADVRNLTVRRAVYVPLPAIATQPPAVATTAGQTATFAVVATGGAAVTFQWQRQPVSGGPFLNLTDGDVYSGTTTATLVLTAPTALMHGDQFRCVIANLAGTIFSAPAGLTVNAAPIFTNASTATFGIGAAGVFAFTTAGAPASTFAVTAGNLPPWAAFATDAGLLSGTPTSTTGSPFVFTITATNSLGTASQTFTLTVPTPAIPVTAGLASGRRQVLPKGQSLTISATAAGTGPLTYQWRRNGLPLTGATSLNHTILNAAATDAGYYQLAVSGPFSSAVSPAIFVAVSHPAAEVVGWGNPLTLPSNLGTATAIAAGSTHGLALRSDGTVTAWGSETANTSVPAGLNDIVGIAAGAYSSYALRSDGTVVAWGGNSYGQISVPAGLSDVVALAASDRHVVALKSDGTVVEWGMSYYYNVNSYPPPAGLSGVIGIAAGDGLSLAIKSDGTVTVWGYSLRNSSGPPTTVIPARSVAISGDAFFAVRADGVVVPWGYSSTAASLFPAAGLSGVARVGATSSQGYALKLDGTLVAWGDLSSSTSLPPTGLRSVFALSVGSSYRLALRDASNDTAPVIMASPASVVANLGQAVSFAVSASAGTGSLAFQWFKDGTSLPGATGSTLTIGNIVAASAGSYHVVVTNSRGGATSSSAILQISASPIVGAAGGGRYPLSPGQSLTLTLSSAIPTSAQIAWRLNGHPIAAATGRSYNIVNATPDHAGYYQAVYTTDAGTVVTEAIFVPFVRAATQVVLAGNTSALSPTPAGFENVVALFAREGALVGLTAAGTVQRASISPTGYFSGDPGSPPAGLDNVVGVSVGHGFAVALRADGTVVVWGSAVSENKLTVPADVSGVVSVAAGTTHALALKADGTVVTWGGGTFAGLTAVPQGLANIVAVAAGEYFSLALRADGTVVGWGRNNSGESAPPSGLSGVVAVAAGSTHALALRYDGTVVAWGANGSGQAVVPAGLHSVTRIAAGFQHSLALKVDGTVVSWGTGNSYAAPVVLVPAGLRDVIDLAAGAAGTSAFLRDATADTAPVITGQPADAAAALGQTAVIRVSASAGTAPLTYVWRKAGVALSGATDATLTLPGVTAASAGTYEVVVSNYLGYATSRTLTLSVGTASGITLDSPARRLVAQGSPLTLTGTAALAGSVTYQWRLNGRAIPGATLASYALPAVRWADNGIYHLVATNAVGPAVSAPLYVAVTGSRQIRAWGSNAAGQGSPPAGLTDVVHLAAGASHVVALRAGGTVVTWGSGEYGLANVPAGLADVIAIAAGSNFSLALRADGSVAAWGQLNYVPASVTDVVALGASAGSSYAMALRADGTVIVWNYEGVRADTPSSLGDLVGLASGPSTHYALRRDGTALFWNNVDYYSSSVATVIPGPTGIAAITQGADYSQLYALRIDGTVVAWSNTASSAYTANPVPLLTGVSSLAASGTGYSYALKSDGTIVSLSTPAATDSAANSVSPALQVASGGSFAIALRDPSGDVAPVITSQPVSLEILGGQAFSLSVTASGSPRPIYQWYRNGQALSGATSATYEVAAAYSYSSAAGTYSVAVTNALGTVTSAEVTVAILTTDLSSRGLFRGSARANATLAPLFATFTLEGSNSRNLLVRGAGPALVPFGFTDALADPTLTLNLVTGATVLVNDYWGSSYSTVSNTASQAGAFPFADGSRDAAFVRTFLPGTYHVTLAGVASAHGGVGLLEIFDTDSSYYGRLRYLSVLAHAGTGNDVFVLGFTLAAVPAGRTYLLRAVGPSLGGTGHLADPRLAVFDSTSTQVAANDDWAGDSTVAAAVTTAGLMPLASAAKDAALVFTPVAGGGTYTVRLNGAPGTTGRVLVELAEIDTQRGATIPVALVSPPRSVTVLPGQSVAFGGVAVGKPTPAYQWRKDGVDLPGATSALLTLAAAQAADAGAYTLVVSNAHGSVTSAPATLALAAQLATHRLVGPGYVAGSTLTVTNTLTFTGTAAGLGWEVVLPAGWTYAGGSGEGDVKPAVGATGTLGWSWTTPPASPLTFTYVLNVPADEASSRTLAATGLVRTGESPQPAALPALVVTAAAPVHSADTNHDNRLNLTELTRVIELYNTRHGTARTGAYAVAATATEDGFEADAARAPGATAALSLFHSADTNRDGAIGLFELTRVIELYNARTGTTRTGAYRSQGSTEDGFAPGP